MKVPISIEYGMVTPQTYTVLTTLRGQWMSTCCYCRRDLSVFDTRCQVRMFFRKHWGFRVACEACFYARQADDPRGKSGAEHDTLHAALDQKRQEAAARERR